MNYKKKSLILSILIIISIQFLLLINNREKTSFRYFIWEIQEVSIGKLILISFISGLFISTLLNKTVVNNIKTNQVIETDDEIADDNDQTKNIEDNYGAFEITPERDIRDTQPTISVNYRVIKNNGNNELKDGSQTLNNQQDEDDWYNNEFEW